MKQRSGFVSNSSSCSFTCDFCGRSRGGWDWDDPEEFGFKVVDEKLICLMHDWEDVHLIMEIYEWQKHMQKNMRELSCLVDELAKREFEDEENDDELF